MKKRRDKGKVWLTIFLALIMVSSIFGFVISSQSDNTRKTTYNNFEFESINNQWVTEINGQETAFLEHPANLESIEIPSEAANLLSNKPSVYLTFEEAQEYDLKFIDLTRLRLNDHLSNLLNIYVINGAVNSSTLPPITCLNATSSVPVIYLKSAQESKITLENNCLIIQAKQNDFISLSERLLYNWLGVIQ